MNFDQLTIKSQEARWNVWYNEVYWTNYLLKCWKVAFLPNRLSWLIKRGKNSVSKSVKN